MKFTQAYANFAVCSATRTGLITGRYQYRLTVGLEEPIVADTPKNIGLPPSHPTLPSLLRAAGYGTTLVGKWHLGFLPDFSPLKSGYDHFFGDACARRQSDRIDMPSRRDLRPRAILKRASTGAFSRLHPSSSANDRLGCAPWKGGAFQWVRVPPGNRSSRKQPEQSWR
jgi:Sulfatase